MSYPNKLIRVGFVWSFPKGWMGGLNYLKNLLHALRSLPHQEIEPVVFIGADADPLIRDYLSPYAEIVETSVLTRNSASELVRRVTRKFFKTDCWVGWVLRRHKIELYSHSDLYGTYGAKVLNWIPDFQHLNLPDMFSAKEIDYRNWTFRKLILSGELIVLSSENALKDLKLFAPELASRGRVLTFVAQPNRALFLNQPEREAAVLKKLGIVGPFFFLPNQFWKHKNHQLVLDALAQLKRNGQLVKLVCSGKMADYRDSTFIEKMKAFVIDQGLDVHFLGLIDFDDVIVLMKQSLAVLNPSLSEGWSTTVEECKVVGKGLILSDLEIHREQNPHGAIFFDPTRADQLAEILRKVWTAGVRVQTEPINLELMTKNFATTYVAMVKEGVNRPIPLT